MRKMSSFVACVAVLATVSVASAQTHVILWTQGACPGQEASLNGTPGNATVFVAPTDQNTTLAATYGVSAAALGYDVASLWVMGDVGCRGDGIANETMASLGLDVRKAAGVGGDPAALAATAWAIANTSGTGTGGTGSAQNPW